MHKRTISAILTLLLFGSFSTALAHTATVQISGTNQYKALRLTPDIYNNANSDLSDIRIKDSKGEFVPYFINTGYQEEYESTEAYQMILINSYIKDYSYYLDYKLASESDHDTIATSIEVTTNDTDFAKTIRVYGSYDNINWDFIQNDMLYVIDGKTKLTIEFGEAQKYTHYRFELANNLENISFTNMNLVYSVSANVENYFVESLTPSFFVEEKDKTTLIKIEGLKNLKLCDISIETDSMFKRTATAQLASSKEIYNLVLNDASYSDTTLPLNWLISKEDTYVITIINNDDKPINIMGITVRYYADEVVFEGNANESYTLEFGADATKTAPVYDIARYQNEIVKGVIDKATIGTVKFEEEEKPTERNYKVVFNIVVIGITILLGGLILYRLKRR